VRKPLTILVQPLDLTMPANLSIIRQMANLAQLLKQRVDQAHHRVEEAREALAKETADLKKWEEALTLELRTGMRDLNLSPSTLSNEVTLSLQDARTKAGIVKAALEKARRPLTPSELIELVKPAISRSMVYNVINQMKDTGELKANEDGRVELVQLEETGS
jgi:hypothetical protein